jgi:hypothetical protein
MMPSRLAACSLLLLPLTGCGSEGSGSADGDRPYKVAFTNDTADAVEVVGCPDCGEGHALAAGAAWETSLDGGSTKVRFDRDGSRVGCIEFINGVLPDDDDPPSVVKVSEYIPCRQ